MTKEELMQLDNAVVEEVPNKFIHVQANEGYAITDWNEKDIKDFTSCHVMYMPIADNYKDYRTITEAENKRLQDLQREEAEKKMKEINK